MLTMLHVYALEGGTGVQYSCKSWLHEDVSLLLILDSTGQPKICPEFFTVRLNKLGRAYFNSARSITHYIKYFDMNIRIQ